MSDAANPLPESPEDLIAFIYNCSRASTEDPGHRAGALAKLAVLVMQDHFVPSMQTLSHELAHTRTVLSQASEASSHYARALVRATWVLAWATGVLVLVAAVPAISAVIGWFK